MRIFSTETYFRDLKIAASLKPSMSTSQRPSMEYFRDLKIAASLKPNHVFGKCGPGGFPRS